LQFDDRSSEIEQKIADLADFILTQQVTDAQKLAYGGFLSSQSSTTCYSVDGKTQTLDVTLELGREKPLLADYVYALRKKTDSLSRYKAAKRGG
jgi:hypothetical protein